MFSRGGLGTGILSSLHMKVRFREVSVSLRVGQLLWAELEFKPRRPDSETCSLVMCHFLGEPEEEVSSVTKHGLANWRLTLQVGPKSRRPSSHCGAPAHCTNSSRPPPERLPIPPRKEATGSPLGNQGGVVTVPSSPGLRRQKSYQERKEAKSARKSESPQAGYTDAPSHRRG